jgi:hypothetical protein
MGKQSFFGFIHRSFPSHFYVLRTAWIQGRIWLIANAMPGHANVYRLRMQAKLGKARKIRRLLLFLRQDGRPNFCDSLVHDVCEIA